MILEGDLDPEGDPMSPGFLARLAATRKAVASNHTAERWLQEQQQQQQEIIPIEVPWVGMGC